MLSHRKYQALGQRGGSWNGNDTRSWWVTFRSYVISGLLYQKQVSRAGTSNYTPQYLWYVITWPSLLALGLNELKSFEVNEKGYSMYTDQYVYVWNELFQNTQRSALFLLMCNISFGTKKGCQVSCQKQATQLPVELSTHWGLVT